MSFHVIRQIHNFLLSTLKILLWDYMREGVDDWSSCEIYEDLKYTCRTRKSLSRETRDESP